MSIFRALDSNGDWSFGNGLQSYAQNNQAIQLDISTTLQTIQGECFFDQSVGLPWFQLLGGGTPAQLILTVKSAIYNIVGVTGVTDLNYNLTTDRALSITYFVDTIYTTQISGTVTI